MIMNVDTEVIYPWVTLYWQLYDSELNRTAANIHIFLGTHRKIIESALLHAGLTNIQEKYSTP